MGEPHQHEDENKAERGRKAPEHGQRTHGIGAPQFEFAAVFGGQRFLQHEKAEQRIGERKTGGDEEGQARAIFAQHATDRRSDDEADAEGRTDEPEIRRALFRRRDIGDIGIGRGVAGARHAGQKAADEQPPDRRRQAGDQIIDAEREQRGDQHRPPAEAIAEIADHRRTQKQHQREDEAEPAAIARGAAETGAPVNSMIRLGATGMMMPSPMVSTNMVMKMKTSAERLAVAVGIDGIPSWPGSSLGRLSGAVLEKCAAARHG